MLLYHYCDRSNNGLSLLCYIERWIGFERWIGSRFPEERSETPQTKAYFNRLKCNTHRLNHLIPEQRDVHYSLRNANVYPIPVTRTDRYKNSIVPWGLCNWQ